MKKLIQTSLMVFLFLQQAHAETGLLRAKVKTSSGALLVNARIVLTGPDGRPLNQIRTGSTGEFSVHLPLGEYQIEVNGGGFGALSRIIRIVPGTTFLSLIIESYPGRFGRRQNALESSDNLSAIVLDEDILRSTFSDDQREFARALSGGQIASGAGQRPFQSQPSNFAGQQLLTTPLLQGPSAGLVGGVDFIVNGEPARLPAKDQIRQAWIDSDPFSAEYSKPGFARVDLITPVEREAFHGAATFSFRDEALNSSYLGLPGSIGRPPHQSRYLHGVLNGPIVTRKLFTSLSVERHGEDQGATLVQALTPTGLISQRVETGLADQVFNNRLQYEISSRNTLNVNTRYQTLHIPNVGVGGTTLPERGFNQSERSWDAQIRETSLLNTAFANEVRFQARHDRTLSDPVREGVAIDVVGGFSGGGASGHSDVGNTNYQLENLLSWAGPRLKLRTGIQGHFIRTHASSSNNTLGTFTFSSLSDYASGKPWTYLQFSGVNNSRVNQMESAAFAQTDWNVSRAFSFSAGVRYESQNNLDDYNNVDPRIGFAYAAQPSLVIRGGVGTFHQRLSSTQVALFRQQNGIPSQTVIFLSDPSYPDPFSSGTSLPTPASSLRAAGTGNLIAPYIVNGSLSIEKWFSSGLIVSVSGDFIRGVHELRSSWNVAADDRVVDYHSAGNTFARNVTLRFRTPEFLASRYSMRLLGDYSFGSSYDDDVLLTGSTDWRNQWGRTIFYTKHHLWTGGTIGFPAHISAGLWLRAHSGFPNAVTTSDPVVRPVASGRKETVQSSNYVNLDASLSKTFTIPLEMSSSGTTLTVFLYGQNVLNSRNFTSVYTDVASPLFGRPFGAGSVRQLEAGARLRF